MGSKIDASAKSLGTRGNIRQQQAFSSWLQNAPTYHVRDQQI